MVPSKTNDDRMNLPSLSLILRELLDGSDVADQDKAFAKIDAMQKQIEDLQKQLAKTAAA